MTDKGYLQITNEADRLAVAAILVKNGYTVTPLRKRAANRTESILGYERRGRDLREDDK